MEFLRAIDESLTCCSSGHERSDQRPSIVSSQPRAGPPAYPIPVVVRHSRNEELPKFQESRGKRASPTRFTQGTTVAFKIDEVLEPLSDFQRSRSSEYPSRLLSNRDLPAPPASNEAYEEPRGAVVDYRGTVVDYRGAGAVQDTQSRFGRADSGDSPEARSLPGSRRSGNASVPTRAWSPGRQVAEDGGALGPDAVPRVAGGLDETSFLIEVMKRTPLFRNLTTQEAAVLICEMPRRHYRPNDTVARGGDVCESMFFIVEGQTAVRVREREIACLRRGDFFGMATMAKLASFRIDEFSRGEGMDVFDHASVLRNAETRPSATV